MNRGKMLINASLLSALAIVLQLSPFWPTTWGMRIDLVAVPWLITVFMFGLETGLASWGISFVILGFIAASSWLGAGMKALATLPLLVLIGLVQRKSIVKKLKKLHLNKHHLILLAFLLAVVLRCIIMLYVNYYFALPIWLSMSVLEVMQAIKPWMIIIPNALQSLVEFGVAWLVVFRTKLRNRVVM